MNLDEILSGIIIVQKKKFGLFLQVESFETVDWKRKNKGGPGKRTFCANF